MAWQLPGDKPDPEPIVAYCYYSYMNYFNHNIKTMYLDMSSAIFQNINLWI